MLSRGRRLCSEAVHGMGGFVKWWQWGAARGRATGLAREAGGGAAQGSGSWAEGGAGGGSWDDEPKPNDPGFACLAAVRGGPRLSEKRVSHDDLYGPITFLKCTHFNIAPCLRKDLGSRHVADAQRGAVW